MTTATEITLEEMQKVATALYIVDEYITQRGAIVKVSDTTSIEPPSVKDVVDAMKETEHNHPIRSTFEIAEVERWYAVLEDLNFNPNRHYKEVIGLAKSLARRR